MNRQTVPEALTKSTPPIATGFLQRKCACGQHANGGKCEECRKKQEMRRKGAFVEPLGSPGQSLNAETRASMESRSGRDLSQVRAHTEVQRLQRQRSQRTMLPPTSTNYAFDTFNLTASHLSDPDVLARFGAMSRAELIVYRSHVTDPIVQDYITDLLATVPSVPCTPTEVSRTNTQAEAARTASVPWLGFARIALDNLHSRWITNNVDILAGQRTLSGQVVCAFDSNFNITQRDPSYGVRQISVMSRLRQLESRLSRAVPYSCQPEDDPVCLGQEAETVAYVRGGQPPIRFCPQFRAQDAEERQSTIVHEYAHFLPGVHDQGGYAGVFGARTMTCQAGAKFRAPSDVLTNTADALNGFVMHIGQVDPTDIHVR